MWKKIVFLVLGIGIGVILGAGLTMAYMGYTAATGMMMVQDAALFSMGESAREAYFHQPREVAVWALEKYIADLDEAIDQRRPAKAENSFLLLNPEMELTFSHTRLGKLYGQMGNTEKSQSHLDQALVHGKRANIMNLLTKEDYLRALEMRDLQQRQSGHE